MSKQWNNGERKKQKWRNSWRVSRTKKKKKKVDMCLKISSFFFLSKRHLLVTEVNKPVEPEAEAFIDMFGFCLQGKCRKK